MNAIQATLEWMGSRFLVSGFIPSLGFVTLCLFAFDPILPGAVSRRIGGSSDLLRENGLVMLIFSIVLGFTITVLSNFFVKVFEGYIGIKRFPFLRRAELRREGKLRRRIRRLQQELEKYYQTDSMNDKRARKMLSALSALIEQHEQEFAAPRSLVMPTRFGNVLKAAEYYPNERYKMEGIIFWPNLVHAIPSAHHIRLAETRNQLSFVVNCSFLSALFGLLCWMAALYQFILRLMHERGIEKPLYFISVTLPANVYEQRTVLYLFFGAAALAMALVFYRVSLVSVTEFAGLIRSSYDLFRFDLIKALHFELPANTKNERTLWLRIGEVMKKGYYWERKGTERQPLTFLHETPQQNTPPANCPLVKTQP